MGIDTKELLEKWFEGVGEEFTKSNVWELFEGDLLPYFEGRVPAVLAEYPAYKTKDSDPEYSVKLETYQKACRENREAREVELLNSGYEFIVSKGGSEGEGEYCYGVIKLGDIYLKAEWSYYSYDGAQYDDILNTLRVVTPKEKTITVYE